MGKAKIWHLLFSNSSSYVAGNIVISALAFLRNIIFMRAMGFDDLGQIALMQSITTGVIFFQFGLINGAYRIYTSGNIEYNRKINDNVFTFLFMLSGLFIICILFIVNFNNLIVKSINIQTINFGLVAGLATLFSTWMNNTLISEGRLKLTNFVNLSAIIISVLISFYVDSMGLSLAFLALLIQPLAISILILTINKKIRPKISLDKAIIRHLIFLGFPPFFAGLLTLLNLQIERWFIVGYLGVEDLGRYSIVIFFTTLFSLIPASLLNIFYPKAVLSYEKDEKLRFISILKKHAKLLFIYISLIILMTIFGLKFALEIFLPKFSGQEQLVYLALPGLVALTFFDTASLLLYSAKKMGLLILYPLNAFLIFLTLTIIMVRLEIFTLNNLVILKSISHILSLSIVIIFAIYFFKNNSINHK
ncbi:lipopolysaccharide biosynthesis protein [Polynucleobacter sphagniphilus]|uniref:lipopolysaccharide biosynthesis protein n=1 Tax=Polynucleobacter sphagniphilus TaxID=1743169 RepID=UPI002476AD41|nr:oligosaccharide flippase family protein [Polynucleobacter sphagniphilus]MDH6525577.1 O-antigen/teichoic acid export membrane protein [Polynucleobacter sphagniphilus]